MRSIIIFRFLCVRVSSIWGSSFAYSFTVLHKLVSKSKPAGSISVLVTSSHNSFLHIHSSTTFVSRSLFLSNFNAKFLHPQHQKKKQITTIAMVGKTKKKVVKKKKWKKKKIKWHPICIYKTIFLRQLHSKTISSYFMSLTINWNERIVLKKKFITWH